MKVEDLKNSELDYWTAKAQGWELIQDHHPQMMYWFNHKNDGTIYQKDYKPSEWWENTGMLLDEYDIDTITVGQTRGAELLGCGNNLHTCFGDSVQEAICRVLIKSVYGEEVEEKE